MQPSTKTLRLGLATGCIKLKKSLPTWKTSNMMLKAVDLDDKRGHLLVVDTGLHEARADVKTLMYNELYTPFS